MQFTLCEGYYYGIEARWNNSTKVSQKDKGGGKKKTFICPPLLPFYLPRYSLGKKVKKVH